MEKAGVRGVFVLVMCSLVLAMAAAGATNGKVAFSSNWSMSYDIYTVNADGSGQTQLTSTLTTNEKDPAWSPDGTKIAFDHNGGIYVMNADGTGGKTHLNNGIQPSWSPDGAKIAFAEYDSQFGTSQIHVMNADGSNDLDLSNNNKNFDSHPSWSPDGTKIAFGSLRNGNSDIYVMNAEGTGVTRVTNINNNYYSYNNWGPSWSPEGTKIAFTSRRNMNEDIYVINIAGTNEMRLTTNSSEDSDPAWSPDGTKIAFTTDRDGNGEIFVMNTDGSVQTVLANTPSIDMHPAWSPGLAITVTSPNGGEDWNTDTPQTITWSQVGLSGTNVKIDLYKGRMIYRQIVSSVPATAGTYPFPDDIPAGSDYRVLITSLTYPGVSDYSNGLFTIMGGMAITLISPNGGEIWAAGTPNSITWSQSGFSGSHVKKIFNNNVKIDLYRGRTFYREIVSSVPATAGTYPFPDDIPAGSSYKVLITSLTSPGVYDITDGWLTVTEIPPTSPKPSAPSPLMNVVLVIIAIGLLAGSGFLIRRR